MASKGQHPTGLQLLGSNMGETEKVMGGLCACVPVNMGTKAVGSGSRKKVLQPLLLPLIPCHQPEEGLVQDDLGPR